MALSMSLSVSADSATDVSGDVMDGSRESVEMDDRSELWPVS